MSTLDEAERLLSQMTPAEKAQILQWVARDLGDAFPGIESTPGVCGGEPCIVRTRVIVEELLHLKVPNHGKLFKALLKAYLGKDDKC
jgi:uncharacterized protein (DUF433 family)